MLDQKINCDNRTSYNYWKRLKYNIILNNRSAERELLLKR